MINLAVEMIPRPVLARAESYLHEAEDAFEKAQAVASLAKGMRCCEAHVKYAAELRRMLGQAKAEKQRISLEEARRRRFVLAEAELNLAEFEAALERRVREALANRPKRTPAPHASKPTKARGAHGRRKAA